MSLGENTLSPLQIQDARDAAHRASELQRQVEDRIRQTSRDLAEAERAFRRALAERIVALHADSMAWSVCETVAKGEPRVADLRFKRDVAAGVHDAARQEAYRRGADRADVARLVDWSARRDLRTDAPPTGESVSVIGGRRAAA